ncbi:TetR/AcrR family transcriptional regulator [Micromonospora sp. NBC_00898]|uniref:TetR/AcrR family transcriptional regulator n=1 Tax=Micromonospora sp. NBC_00898 TaxID=2975981 RepID=UPI0038668D31|nr:TetR/AcrR family transcriptional regulator [Micromonospora sp. NBC_00898]
MSEPDGSLRARLVEVGVDLVAREGSSALSLREIARRAGVSHGAPRRYFPTYQALLAAIARQGYVHLGQQVAELVGDEDADPYAQLLALGRLYVQFAQANRGMFELMFRHDLLRGNNVGLREASGPLFRVLVGLVTRARPTPPGGPASSVVAGALWANLHGIAQLWLWGSLQAVVEMDDVEPLLRAALDAHLRPTTHF